MDFTIKQAECLLQADARWNIFSGATRAGKTVITYFLLLMRIKELPEGRCVMIGKTISTLEYNVLMPMRDMFGSDHVSEMKINSAGLRYVIIFGREFRCVGANDKRSVTKIQGSGLIYAYGDEVATWDENIFNMLKSRLDSKHAKFDGTTNPDAPNHWLKKFIDGAKEKKLNVKLFHFIIDDNTFLDQEFIDSLKAEYAGTVYYDRYILGRWVAAEGSIYTTFIGNKKEFIIDVLPQDAKGFITVGVDYGGNKSGHSFNATLVDIAHGRIFTIKDYWKAKKMNPSELENEFIKFIRAIQEEFKAFKIAEIRADSAEQVLINGFNSALINNKIGLKVSNAKKGEINERIRFYTRLFGARRYQILSTCNNTIEAFEGAVWRETNGMQDERLDDGTSNIDTLDSQEYSTESFMKALLKIINYGGKKMSLFANYKKLTGFIERNYFTNPAYAINNVAQIQESFRQFVILWDYWYRGHVADFHDYNVYNGSEYIKKTKRSLQMAKKVCEDRADLLLNEQIKIVVDDAEAQKAIDDVLTDESNMFRSKMNELIEKMCALGTGALVEFRDREKTLIDYVTTDKVIPITIENGRVIDCVLLRLQDMKMKKQYI